MLFTLILQSFVYNHKVKDYHCSLPELGAQGILCTVPILDLLVSANLKGLNILNYT